MNFEYRNFACNLLDTPGHQDFSEDTYRTLAAADAAIMLIDGAKGVEPQTIKLFQVCQLRKIPIFTFINKFDRECQDPLVLLENIENVLGIATYPMTWPVSSGERFGGIIARDTQNVHYFQGRNVSFEPHTQVFSLADMDNIKKHIPQAVLEESLESFHIVEIAGETFSQEKFLTGALSPVFFGAAMTNFGVRLFLEKFLDLAPPPSAKKSRNQGFIEPFQTQFSGFIFKIQANMDPRHRDRIAFLRVVSGVYKTGLSVFVPRLNREIRLTAPQHFFAQERTATDQAFAGDIVGVYDPGLFAIGDSLVEGGGFAFEEIPSFAPEHFAAVRMSSAFKRKQLLKALEQLCQEGTVQMFFEESRGPSDPILAAVGSLQFDVLLFRLQHEYGVDCLLEPLSFQHARWTHDLLDQDLTFAVEQTGVTSVRDTKGHPLFLFKNNFALKYFQEKCGHIQLFCNSIG
jgi:peptide chain release factor 3